MTKASIRANALTLTGHGDKTLKAMDDHGKRLDQSSQRRRIRDVEPLVYGSLDLMEAYTKHVEGCTINKGAKKLVQHAVLKMPQLELTPEYEGKMLKDAVDYINASHGGRAVFAARLDRDEAGRFNVDVFFSPIYTKTTKDRRTKELVSTDWMSCTKFGKEICEKHADEIRSRHKHGKFDTSPRSVGIALQSDFYEFLEGRGYEIEPRTPKDGSLPDRLEVDAFKRVRQEEVRANARLDVAEDQIEQQRAELEKMRKILQRERSIITAIVDQVRSVALKLAKKMEVLLPSDLREAITALEIAVDDLSPQKSKDDQDGPELGM